MPGRGPVVPEVCQETGSRYLVGGPFWSGPLHDMDLVTSALQEIKVEYHLCGHYPYLYTYL